MGRASSRDRGQPESYRAGLSRGPQSAHDQGIISGSPRGLTWMSLNPGRDVVAGPHSPRSAVPRRLRAPGSTSPPTSVPRSAPRPFPSRSSPWATENHRRQGQPLSGLRPGPPSSRPLPSLHSRTHSSKRGVHSDSRGWPRASSCQGFSGHCALTPQPPTLAPYAGVLSRALCPQGTWACLEMVLLS